MSGALATIEDVIAEHGEDAVQAAARRAMWRAGDLSFFCSDVQETARALVYEHPSRRVVWETNRRFGKSRTCVTISGEHCLAFPGVRIPYAAPTAVQVRNFVHPPMLELTTTAPDDLAPEIVKGEWVFPPLRWLNEHGDEVRTKLHGGVELDRYRGPRAEEQLRMSRVAPVGCEDRRKADALRGTGTVFAVIDEMRDIFVLLYVLGSVVGPMLWEARSRWHDDVSPTMLCASTPPSEPDHPMIEVADAAIAKEAYFHATVYDCDHLDERAIAEAIEEAGGESTLQWQVEGLARRMRDPSRVVFVEFARETHVCEPARPTHIRPCVVGDGGHEDMAGFLFGYFDFEAAIVVVERELVFHRTRSDVMDAAIAEMERELWPVIDVVRRRVDAPPQVRADMNREEWGDPRAEVAPGEERPHWTAVTKPRSKALGSMRSGVNRVRVMLSGDEPSIAIHPSCTTTIAHVDGARWDTSRNDFVRVRDEKGEPIHHYDLAAALVYFVRDVDRENPYPARRETMIDRFREHRRPRDQQADNIRGLFRRNRR